MRFNDRIMLKNMCFYGYHGVKDEEKKLGQKFYVDVEIFYNMRKSCKSDDLNDTINYVDVYNECKKIVEEDIYDLIETLAQEISDRIFEKFAIIDKNVVRVRKPEAPIRGALDYVEVEVTRERNED